jgi:hypothetical protein
MAETAEQYLAAQRAVVRTLLVEIHAGGFFSIHEGDRTTGELAWDEALGSFAELTHPRIGQPRYAMRTQSEWVALYPGIYGGQPRPNPLKDGEGLLPAPVAPTNHRIERIDTRSLHNRLSPSDSDWMNDPAALF